MSNKQINNKEADLQLASLIIFTNEIEVVKTYFTNVSKLEKTEDIKAYSQGYRDLVLKSNISVNSANSIQSTISVAANSSQLWKVTNNN